MIVYRKGEKVDLSIGDDVVGSLIYRLKTYKWDAINTKGEVILTCEDWLKNNGY